MSRVLRSLGSILPLGFGRARLLVLAYHRVLPAPDPMRPSELYTEAFEAQARTLARFFNPLPLSEAVTLLGAGRLPRRAVSITFDDGYADNATVALPILRRHGLPATVFVATGFLDGGLMWHDAVLEGLRSADGPELDLARLDLGAYAIGSAAERHAAAQTIIREIKYLPVESRQGKVDQLLDSIGVEPSSALMLTTAELAGLAGAGVEIGAHTHRHPILASLTDDQARGEIARSKRVLEGIVGRPVDLFAYPNGRPLKDYTARDVALVREAGFGAAVSTAAGTAGPGDDRYQLPRFGPWAEDAARFAVRLLGAYGAEPGASA